MRHELHQDHDRDPLFSRLAGAMFVSVLLHTSFFAVVHLGNLYHWWDARPFALFRKVRLTPEEIAQLQEAQRQAEAQQPTIFVQVTQPADEPPVEDTPYYSSLSSLAANPQPGDQDQPRLEGTQNRSIRLEEAPALPTGRPTPPPPSPERVSSETRPEPVRTPPPRPEPVVEAQAPVLAEARAEPARAPGIGELALVQPQVRVESPAPVEPVRVPEPVPPPEKPWVRTDPTAPSGPATPPPKARPRTVTEARIRQNLLAGEKMQQEGGVARVGGASMNVKGTGFGAYDEVLALTVQNRWFALLDARRYAGRVVGEVVVNFKLYADGSVRIVEPTRSTVDPLHANYCVRAISDPAPFEKWPEEMLRVIGSNFREVRFTFYYN